MIPPRLNQHSSARSTAMNRHLLTIGTLAAVTACSGNESGMSRQACRLIEDNNATAIQIFNEIDTDAFGTGATFAENLHGWIEDDCAEVLDDPAWVSYFNEYNL